MSGGKRGKGEVNEEATLPRGLQAPSSKHPIPMNQPAWKMCLLISNLIFLMCVCFGGGVIPPLPAYSKAARRKFQHKAGVVGCQLPGGTWRPPEITSDLQMKNQTTEVIPPT